MSSSLSKEPASPSAAGQPLTAPSPPNPLLTAYENFVGTTPFVSRSLFSVQVVTYLLSWFLPLDYALANFPQLTLFQLELYRLLTSPLANTSLFDLLLAYFVVVPVAKRLEWGMGSIQLGYLCGSLALWSNLAFLLACSVLYLASASEAWLVQSTGSIWIVAFGLLAVDALQAEQAHSEKHRRVCFFTVPTRYFPLAFCLLFSVLSLQVNMGLLISLALGYAIGGRGGSGGTAATSSAGPSSSSRWIDPWNVSASRAQHWENSSAWLAQLSSRVGWVSSQSAAGMAAWTMDPPGHSGSDAAAASNSGLPLFQMPARRASSGEAPKGGGRTLGGAARRALDPRAARLQALEGRRDPDEASPA